MAQVVFENFVRYIKENYSGARKIVEVGVGHRIDVALMVKLYIPNAEVIVTDKDEKWIRTRKTPKVRAVADDVAFPSMPVYEGAGLIYSLQPPLELVPSMIELAGKVSADLLIAPLRDEQEAFHRANWSKVVREGRTVGWVLAARHNTRFSREEYRR
ncbi:hypothetical protein E6H36_03530 [Candidatus Bathyarchaeota archaeon]|nr:MAG: hypothetical protein E6H36_03530 [Candidatus Bathyarchaeota archaeon]TMI31759.1 MAG: hypothetical protein E6H29_03340 [Candidatus Bathyarchaeota archaeon]